LYVYFSHNPKKRLEFTKLAEVMEIKRNKILRNIKTRWISIISLVKRVLSEYCTFHMRITLNAPTIASTKSNLCLLTNVKTLLRLNAIMPLLDAIHSLIKFSQLRDVFMCEFITIMKICELGMYILNVLWQPILFPRWCVSKFPCPYQFCSWEHKSLVDHKFKYMNKSLSFWVCRTTGLGHICKSNWGI
jgi:hypothetical protein